jgi:hypothetical protein
VKLPEGTWTLPDGRTLRVRLVGLDGPDHGGTEGWWECDLGTPGDYINGSPLVSTLATVLGHDVMDGWPEWIDELATKIERELRPQWGATSTWN